MSNEADCNGRSDGTDFEGELDPRVQEELERLNQSSNQINTLETNLTKARNDYRILLQVSFKHRLYSIHSHHDFKIFSEYIRRAKSC